MAVDRALLEIIRCPECRGTLSAFDSGGRGCQASASSNGARVLRCDACRRWFPIVDEIPRLLPDVLRDVRSDEDFFASNQGAFSQLPVPRSHFGNRTATPDVHRQFQKQRLLWGTQERWEDLYLAPVRYAAPDRAPNPHAKTFFSMNLHCHYGTQPRKDEIIVQTAASGGKLTLDIGCAAAGKRALLRENGNRYVGLDVQAFSGPDIQATAASLPFGDATFDFVICDSVLEHVHDPWKVSAEIFRILKPGGKGLFVVPFIYKSHGAPFDFFRYTKSGLHTLLREYSVVKIFSFGTASSAAAITPWWRSESVRDAGRPASGAARCRVRARRSLPLAAVAVPQVRLGPPVRLLAKGIVPGLARQRAADLRHRRAIDRVGAHVRAEQLLLVGAERPPTAGGAAHEQDPAGEDDRRCGAGHGGVSADPERALSAGSAALPGAAAGGVSS